MVELSIVTITYNDNKGLRETTESLRGLLGSGIAWEHVVVDSSSSLNQDYLGGLKAQGWPLLHLSVPAEGVYSAMNAGITAAKGRVLWFLNGGDLLKDVEAVRNGLAAFRDRPNIELLVSSVELRRDGRFLYFQRASNHPLRNLLGTNRICHQGVLYRREIFEKAGLFSTSLKIAADYEHHFKAVAVGASIAGLPENVLAIYDMSGRSNDYQATFREFKAVHRKMSSQLPGWVNFANEGLRPLEYGFVALLKTVAASPLASVFRPIWLGAKRMGRKDSE
jgi:glycosyltransferase involved in cell wall biosynthesis